MTTELDQRLAGAREVVRDSSGTPTGYFTWFTGAYVCLACGHLCDCGDDDE